MAGEELNLRALSAHDLLAILDPNPERAEEKYVELYRKLTRYFEWNRRPEPEDLAQEALKRGFSRLQEGQKITVEDPSGYFFGIARNLLRESTTVRQEEELEDWHVAGSKTLYHGLDPNEQIVFLKECLERLPQDDFELLRAYIEGKADVWAKKTGIPSGTVRMRIHRIRRRLEQLIARRGK
jgi:DNA-directed RNA polymerase specialized sigma24 family protein